MIGNTLLKNGQYIFINPVAIGAGNPSAVGSAANLARQIGLGGYFLVTGVDHTISESGFEVQVTALHQAMRKNTAQTIDVSAPAAQEEPTPEDAPATSDEASKGKKAPKAETEEPASKSPVAKKKRRRRRSPAPEKPEYTFGSSGPQGAPRYGTGDELMSADEFDQVLADLDLFQPVDPTDVGGAPRDFSTVPTEDLIAALERAEDETAASQDLALYGPDSEDDDS
jgi:hypothetical protein